MRVVLFKGLSLRADWSGAVVCSMSFWGRTQQLPKFRLQRTWRVRLAGSGASATIDEVEEAVGFFRRVGNEATGRGVDVSLNADD